MVEQGGTTSPSRKKRKKKDSIAAVEAPQIDAVPVIVLGLSDGTIQLFSPNSGRVLRTVSSPTSTSPILSAVTAKRGFSTILWTSSGDTTIRIWNPTNNTILSSWKNGDRTPYTRLSPQPPSSDGDDSVKLLAANQAIKLLQTTAQPNEVDGSKKPIDLATFSGHTSNVLDLQWDLASSNEPRFLSIADADRFVYLWQLPSDISSRRDPIASIPLDSDARAIALSIPLSNYLPSSHQNQRLLTLTAAGRISIYPIPSEVISPSANTKGQPLKPSLPTLVPRSVLAASSKNTPSNARVVGATFASGEQGHVRVARVIGGIRPVFDSIRYLDEAGEFIPDVVINDVPLSLPEESWLLTIPNKRYTEAPSLAVRSGGELGQDEEMDDLPLRDVDGDLDADLAELSLGQRLTALSGGNLGTNSDDNSDSESESEEPEARGDSKSKSNQKSTAVSGKGERKRQRASLKNSNKDNAPIAPANSLTRTLIQALHSSDSRLLESCLAHSDVTLIRNSVRRLPPQLAVPLINSCVERLGRGARAGNMKGGGAGTSTQRGSGLISWIKAVLAVHSGYLMTIPDLVARLASLHSTLTARLALHQNLLTLSGKLDMVLSQIEMRSSLAPAPLSTKSIAKAGNSATGKGKSGKSANEVNGVKIARYVEGESSSSDDDDMNVEVEKGSGDEGSVEDVELGGVSDSSDGDEISDGEVSGEELPGLEDEGEDEDDDEGGVLDSDDEDGDSDDDDDTEPTINGFIDDEAEEGYSEEEDEESD